MIHSVCNWVSMTVFFVVSHGHLAFADTVPTTAKAYEQLTGFKGTYNENEKVYRVSFLRTDIRVSVKGTTLAPFMGIASWAAFTPVEQDSFLVMGDFVLRQDEVNSALSVALENGLEITALHNHFFYDTPNVFFMHIEGTGPIKKLASALQAVLDDMKQSKYVGLAESSFGNSSTLVKAELNIAQLESVFGIKAQTDDEMVKFVFGQHAQHGSVKLGSDMGINSWAAFVGSDSSALVDGDIAVDEDGLQKVLITLRKGNINIVAIHNHMIHESPRLIYVHFWGRGKLLDLANTLNKALGQRS